MLTSQPERARFNAGWAATGTIIVPAAVLAKSVASAGNPGVAVLIATAGGMLGVCAGSALAARARAQYWPAPMPVSTASLVTNWAAAFLTAWGAFLAWPGTTNVARPGEVNEARGALAGEHRVLLNRVHVEPAAARAVYCIAGFGFVGGTSAAWRISRRKRSLTVGIATAVAVLFGAYVGIVAFYLGFGVLARLARPSALMFVVCATLAGTLGAAIGGAIAEAALWSLVGKRGGQGDQVGSGKSGARCR